jgi:hypothetical protein
VCAVLLAVTFVPVGFLEVAFFRRGRVVPALLCLVLAFFANFNLLDGLCVVVRIGWAQAYGRSARGVNTYSSKQRA